MSLLVSAYYRIPSKQPHSFYQEHLKRFFRFLAGKPIVFFCEDAMQQEIRGYGVPLDTVEFITIPVAQLPELSRISHAKWDESCRRDPEKYHTPQLGMIWCCKKEFVRIASERHPEVNWFTWVDAGCIRENGWENSCRGFTTRQIRNLAPGVYIQCIVPIKPKEFYQYPAIHIAGAIIHFHRQYIHKFIDSYLEQVNRYHTNKKPFVMDQYIYASMLTLENDWLHAVPNRKPCIDQWFFFLDWL
jgi:hypothetical protein